MRECALCGEEILGGDLTKTVVTAITDAGVASGEAHNWCADSVAAAVEASKARAAS